MIVHLIFKLIPRGIAVSSLVGKDLTLKEQRGTTKDFWTSYPIKEQVTENLVIFQFYSSKELQSLKDALNLETARQELLNKTKSSEEIDSLFK